MSVHGEADQAGVYAEQEERAHNQANEIEQRSWNGGPTLQLDYDDAGNIRSQDVPVAGDGSGGPPSVVTITYVHDAWNRLVRVEYGGVARAAFEYNALHYRVTRRADTSVPPDGDLNQQRVMFYSSDWRLLEERIDDDVDDQAGFDEDRRMQYVWGIRGTDDIALRREDTNLDGQYSNQYYHLTDLQYSTIAIIDQAGTVVERVSYDAYGRPRHHRMADLTGDGSVGSADHTVLLHHWGAMSYADLNRDGTVDTNDQSMMLADWGAALPAGTLSLTDNIFGYAGYIYDAELHIYLARHRWYDPELGRWLQRDPAGYVDGMNLYLYGLGSPFVFVDPMGLMSWRDRGRVAGAWGKGFVSSIWQNTGGAVIAGTQAMYCLGADRTKFMYSGVRGDAEGMLSTDIGQSMMEEVLSGSGPIEATLNVHVIDPAKAIAGGVSQTFQDAAAGDVEAIGSILRAPGEMIIGAKGIDKAGDLARMSRAADRGTDAARTSRGRQPTSYSLISEQSVTGRSRSTHRRQANNQFLDQINNDPVMRRQLDEFFGTDTVRHMQSGRSGLRNPPGTEWHHPVNDPRSVQLMLRQEHRSSILQDLLHPSGQGGYSRYFPQ